MKFSELKRKLRKAGCFPLRDGSRHEIWINPATGGRTELGRHNKEEVPLGTLKSIYKELFG
ncbi:MAG: type II toxin-antitoxin system HicA family toxin [Bacteroidaceae bacterium]|nr:type II toxin-antitoxin system HicA family toxin [Bacteroidaceae bacterium]